MKNHKYMLAMLLSSSLLVGCQGDFLNLPSETSLSIMESKDNCHLFQYIWV